MATPEQIEKVATALADNDEILSLIGNEPVDISVSGKKLTIDMSMQIEGPTKDHLTKLLTARKSRLYNKLQQLTEGELD